DWTRLQLDQLDRKTRKLMTAHHALHPQSDVDRLYLARTEGGRGLLQVRQSVEEEECALSHYVSDSAEPAMKEVNKEGLLKPSETKAEYRQEVLNERGRKWRAKALHGQYLKVTEDKINKAKTWKWLTNGEMKKETEGLILAAQEQAPKTNAIKCRIDEMRDSRKNADCATLRMKQLTT